MTYDPTPSGLAEQPGQPDPLAGRDPFPRHEIDVLALHDARRDLLEEIVSTPGASSPAPSTHRALVAVGIAAALLLVLGGAWFATGGTGSGDDPTVASGPTSDVTPDAKVDEAGPDDESPPPEPDEADEADDSDVRVDGVEVGRVVPLQKCRRFHDGDVRLTLKELQRSLERLGKVSADLDRGTVKRRGDHLYMYLGKRGSGRTDWVLVEDDCRLVERDR